jgi:inorganic pyrophosphatase
MAATGIPRIRPFGPKSEYVNVIIGTPRGSRTKYKYDEDYRLFVFDKSLPLGTQFPFDFGFVPSTEGGDGDPLDVLVLTDEPTFTGCLIHAKLLGVLEAEQTADGKTERNDRLIAIPIEVSSEKPPAGAMKHLAPALAHSITKFFVKYNELQGRRFKLLRSSGPERAATLIRAGMSRFQKRSAKARTRRS